MPEHEPHGSRVNPETIAAGHETAEVPARPVALFMAGISVAVLIIFLAMIATFKIFAKMEDRTNPPLPALEAANRGRLPPEPRLQVTPRLNYLAFKGLQDSVLESYGWVNKDSALVRIPIERAIQILAEQGLPARSGRAVQPDLRMRDPLAPVEPVPEHGTPRGLRMREPAAPVEPAPGKATSSDTAHGGHRR